MNTYNYICFLFSKYSILLIFIFNFISKSVIVKPIMFINILGKTF